MNSSAAGSHSMKIPLMLAIAVLAVTAAVVIVNYSDDSDAYVGETFTITTSGYTLEYEVTSEEYVEPTAYIEGYWKGYVDLVRITENVKKGITITQYVMHTESEHGDTKYYITKIRERAFADTDITSVNSYSATFLNTIEKEAFAGCAQMTFINIGAGVSDIGDSAFDGCEKLQTINVNTSNTTYSSDKGVLYDKGKTELIRCPIKYNYSSYELPNTVTYVHTCALSGCGKIETITVATGNTAYSSNGGVLFDHDGTELIQYPTAKGSADYTMPSTVITIAPYAFAYASELKTITIPDRVTSIGEYAFSECAVLRTVTLPSGITEISEHMFCGCPTLQTVNIKEGTEKIREYAFSECTVLESITIPDTVEKMDECVFKGCISLKSITLPLAITKISDSTFEGCESLSSVTIQKNVTEIGESAFRDCIDLKSISFPKNLRTVGSDAFSGCMVLKTIMFTADLDTIGTNAFGLGDEDNPVVCSVYGCTNQMLDPYKNDHTTFYYYYTIKFDVNGGSSLLPDAEVPAGVPYEVPGYTGSKTGHSFRNWDDGETTHEAGEYVTISKNMTYTAVWDLIVYSIKYELGGGEGEFPDSAEYLEEITIANPTKIGYRFLGWTATGLSDTAEYFTGTDWEQWDGTKTKMTDYRNLKSVSGVVTLTADWYAITYTIVYDKNGGGGTLVDGTESAVLGSHFVLPSLMLSKTGYTHIGWSYDKENVYRNLTEKFTEELILAAEGTTLTMYAMWAPIFYTVLYDLDGGTPVGEMPSTVYFDVDLMLEYPTKIGYTFTGWSSEDVEFDVAKYLNGENWEFWYGETVLTTGLKNLIGVENKVINLTAHWTKITYTIVYDKNGGVGDTEGGTTSAQIGDVFELPKQSAMTNTGYQYKGWSYDKEHIYKNKDKVFTEELILAAKGTTLTMYAMWTPGTYYLKVSCIEPDEISGTAKSLTMTGPFSFTISPNGKITYSDLNHKTEELFFDANTWQEGYAFYLFMYSNNVVTSDKTIECEKYTRDGTEYIVELYMKMIYHIVYDKNGGTAELIGGTETAVLNGEFILPEVKDPKKEDHLYLGWSYNGISVYDNKYEILTEELIGAAVGDTITMYMLWIRTYKVYVDLEGVETMSVSQDWKLDPTTGYYTQTIVSGKTLDSIDIEVEKEPTPKYIYTHSGWMFKNRQIVEFPYMPTSDSIIYAHYDLTVRSYTISYVSETEKVDQILKYGTVIEPIEGLPKASTDKFDYTFTYWEGYVEGMTVTGDDKFTACYERTPIIPAGDDMVIEADDEAYLKFSKRNISTLKEKARNGDVTLTVELQYGTVMFDNDAILAFTGSDTLSVVKSDGSMYPQKVREEIGNSPVFISDFGINNSSGKGTIYTTVPYTLAEGRDPSDLQIYRIGEDEIEEKLKCTYVEGYVSFSSDSLGSYAVVYKYTEKRVIDTGLLIGGITGTMVTIMVATFLILRRH